MTRQGRQSAGGQQQIHEEANMAVVSPWHSINEPVHHNNTDCNTGNNIEPENRREGDGGKRLCKECEGLA